MPSQGSVLSQARIYKLIESLCIILPEKIIHNVLSTLCGCIRKVIVKMNGYFVIKYMACNHKSIFELGILSIKILLILLCKFWIFFYKVLGKIIHFSTIAKL